MRGRGRLLLLPRFRHAILEPRRVLLLLSQHAFPSLGPVNRAALCIISRCLEFLARAFELIHPSLPPRYLGLLGVRPGLRHRHLQPFRFPSKPCVVRVKASVGINAGAFGLRNGLLFLEVRRLHGEVSRALSGLAESHALLTLVLARGGGVAGLCAKPCDAGEFVFVLLRERLLLGLHLGGLGVEGAGGGRAAV